jgi:hypothetical protein
MRRSRRRARGGARPGPAQARQPAAKTLRRAFVNLLLAGTSLFVTVVVVELIAGLIFCPSGSQFVRAPEGFPLARGVSAFSAYAPVLGWRGRPDLRATFYDCRRCPTYTSTVIHNSRGFRDREHDPGQPTAARRVLILGDSFAWGWGVEQNFPALLQGRFDQAGVSVEVINLGVIGYATDQEMLLYGQQGADYRPDLVVLSFVDNDYGENMLSWTWGYARPRFAVGDDGTLALAEEPYEVAAWTDTTTRYGVTFDYWLNDYSLVYRLVKMPFYRRPEETGWPSEEEVRLTLALLGALRDGVRESGSEFAVMAIPDYEQVTSPAVSDPDWYTHVVKWCADTDTLLLEPRVALRSHHAQGEKLHFVPFDPHWTQRGHEVIADYMFEQLRDRLD